jgi:hypothetical protein
MQIRTGTQCDRISEKSWVIGRSAQGFMFFMNHVTEYNPIQAGAIFT